MANFTRRRLFLESSVCLCCACVPLARAFAVTSTASVGTFGAKGLPSLLELGMDPMTRLDPTVWISQLAPKVWLHTTTAIIPEGEGTYFPANGLIVEVGQGSLLIDTGYSPEQAEVLLQWAKHQLNRPITQALVTHFHRDRTGGIAALRNAAIPVFAHPLTFELGQARGATVPTAALKLVDGKAQIGAECEVFFPGGGHTRDNVVAWLPDQRVLFGGCFLKSVTSPDLGNMADAVVSEWAQSVARVHRRYATPKLVVPGHGTMAGHPVAHTQALLANHLEKL